MRELVHRGRAQKSPDRSDTRIASTGLDRADLRFGVGDHRPEFQYVETSARTPGPLLPVEHRPAILELDCGRKENPEGRREDQARAGQCNIESTFSDSGGTIKRV